MVVIQIGDTEVKIFRQRVMCDDEVIRMLLSTEAIRYNASGSDPNPDLSIAQDVVGTFGGRITHADDVLFDDNLIY